MQTIRTRGQSALVWGPLANRFRGEQNPNMAIFSGARGFLSALSCSVPTVLGYQIKVIIIKRPNPRPEWYRGLRNQYAVTVPVLGGGGAVDNFLIGRHESTAEREHRNGLNTTTTTFK